MEWTVNPWRASASRASRANCWGALSQMLSPPTMGALNQAAEASLNRTHWPLPSWLAEFCRADQGTPANERRMTGEASARMAMRAESLPRQLGRFLPNMFW